MKLISNCLLSTVMLLAWAGTVFGQDDLQGRWQPTMHEDWVFRIEGGKPGDYQGLPLNDQARAYADTWHPARFALQEHQCRAHTSPYQSHSPMLMQIRDELDPLTRELQKIVITTNMMESVRTIWMDGREHPGPEARHTWMGFSTGQWDGNALRIKTTHIKHGYSRRNGVPQSDQATISETFVRHGDRLVFISVTEDPVYFTEPLVRTSVFEFSGEMHGKGRWSWSCDPIVEVMYEEGHVPSYHLGENPHIYEVPERLNLPVEAFRGKAETLYPEYIGR